MRVDSQWPTMGSRLLMCVLLLGSLITTAVSLSVFTTEYIVIQKNSAVEACSLFIQFSRSPRVARTGICRFVIGASSTVILLVVLLLVESISSVLCGYVISK